LKLDPLSTAVSVSRARELASAAFYQLQAAGHLAQGGAVMLLFGPFMFAMRTAAYQTLRHTMEFRWAAQPRIGRRPARQFVGPGDEGMELAGFVLPEWNGGPFQISALRALGSLGEALPFVDGRGVFHGRWCLEEVEETGSLHRENGAPRRIDFRLRLSAYAEDEAVGALEQLDQLVNAL